VTVAPDTPPVDLLSGITPALEPDFRLDSLVALSRERALYRAWDRRLKRPVALRVHLLPESPGRAWFLRESEALAALDHPAVRHVFAAGEVGPFAYRTTNWIDGESLAEAIRRGPRAIPSVMSLVRDLLGALEHAHSRGVIIRRIVPTTLILEISGRAVVTDLRYSNWCRSHVPPDDPALSALFVAPEVRAGGVGEPASEVFAVAAIVYYALTGREPDATALAAPRTLRPAIPAAVERVLLRALHQRPEARYQTATEMLEDFVVDAGVFHEPAAAPSTGEKDFERRLRRALGDDYELLEEIGSGGYGRVYRVRDLGLEREVAIKVLHPALTADPGVMERFRREAQLAARLRHANIVSVYDIQSRAGLQWYVMELVPGANLSQIVEWEGPFRLPRTVRLLFEALDALGYAHGLGLVHRDIKPENLLLEPNGLVRITDFGLALALRGERFSGATSRSGTPQFAAPEQLLGERVDPRADLYSLGAVAYFALLGHPPFEGPTPQAILAKQTVDALPPLRETRADVSRELEDVLRHAVTCEPDDRFQTAAAFRQALERVRGGVLKRMLALLKVG
jgi:serine/threonine protein kinase